MLRVTRMVRAAPSRVQQRLFTGALFTEELNDAVCAFARRHRLRSPVWVPQKAFDTVLRPYRVYVLPTAKLCDVALSDSSAAADASCAIGDCRVLVNADDTSNPRLIETFGNLLMPAPPTALAHDSASAPHATTARTIDDGGGGGGGNKDAPLSLQVHLPLTTTGAPVRGAAVVQRLLELQRRAGYRSNYWVKAMPRVRDGGEDGAAARQRTRVPYFNVATLPFVGRYNPRVCVYYNAHTYTGLPFPRELHAMMCARAVKYGYVSRTWVTLYEAERRFGTRLRRERADDAPAVCTTHFSGGCTAAVVYYCADQFDNSEELFASARELRLAASGVPVRPSVLRAFPLLRSLFTATARAPASAHDSNNDKNDSDKGDADKTRVAARLLWHDGRCGADVSMADAARHVRFAAATRMYDELSLFGFRDQYRARALLDTGLRTLLRQQCVLRHFASPQFISARKVVDYNLRPLPHEYGVPFCTVPSRLWGPHALLSGDCWYNVSQLREPDVVHELAVRYPTHALTGKRLSREVAVRCCRVQCTRGDHYRTPLWLPSFVLRSAGWPLRAGAVAVEYTSAEHTRQLRVRTSILRKMMYNVADVVLPAEALPRLLAHTPVDTCGRLFTSLARLAMKLRAYERDYTSPVWVRVGDATALRGLQNARGTRLLPLRGMLGCKATPKPCSSRVVRPLWRVSPFLVPPFVNTGCDVYVNAEELTTLPLHSSPPPPRAKETAVDDAKDDAKDGQQASLTRQRCVPDDDMDDDVDDDVDDDMSDDDGECNESICEDDDDVGYTDDVMFD